MFISGSQYDFENRLHQLPTTTGDLQTFITEYSAYSGDATAAILEKWDRELLKKRIILNFPE
jgi:hypothetical protein